MATEMEIDNEQSPMALSWETCPPEILIMIFEKLPPPALECCMFVNIKWRTLVEHVINHKNMWRQMVEKVILCSEDYKQKSKSMDWRQIYYNYVLWNNLPKSTISLRRVHNENIIKKISMYRDNLIVVTYENVQYYNVDSFELQKTVEISCRDFIENDFMILVAYDNFDKYRKLRLYKKQYKDDFNMSSNNMIIIEKVLRYMVVNKRCYVLDYVNNLFVCGIFYPEWLELFTGRYYGTPRLSCYLNIFHKEMFLMLKNGCILSVDKKTRNFKEVSSVSVPLVERADAVFCKMFHKFGFVFGVPATENFCFDRYTLLENNIFWFRCPGLSCVTQHNEILILGYLNGMIEFFMPRLVTSKEPLRRLNLRDLKADVEDVEVMSIDVHEDRGFHHLFIANNSEIFHLEITYPDCVNYMWNSLPEKLPITVSVDAPTP